MQRAHGRAFNTPLLLRYLLQAVLFADESFVATLMKVFTSSNKQVRENASVIATTLLESDADFRVKFVSAGGFGALNKLVTLNKDCPMKSRNGVGPSKPSSFARFLPVSQYLLELASGVWVLECGVLSSPGA